MGSFAELPLGDLGAENVSVHAWFRATVPHWDTHQTILALTTPEGDESLTVTVWGEVLYVGTATGVYVTDLTIKAGIWYSLALTRSATGDVVAELYQIAGLLSDAPLQRAELATHSTGPVDLLRIGARKVAANGSAVDGFNGKIDSPRVFGRVLSDAERAALHQDDEPIHPADRAWVFDANFNSRTLPEVKGRSLAGVVFNGAERGVTGHNWTGAVETFNEDPSQYGAVCFHSDEMVDSGWEYDLTFELPADLSSGIYAVRLEAGGNVDRYPLFVRGPADSTADVLFIVPTATYLAYANDRFAGGDMSGIMGHERGEISADEQWLNDHPHFGLSCYDVHADGSPVRYTSRRRPLVNVRPHYPAWLTGSYRHFAVDLFFVEWLERSGFSYHVATDEDVDREGIGLLGRYRVVTTGSHPEYWSSNGLDAVQEHVSDGGRLMYLGGNGFYWVTTYDPDRPWIVEIRRDQASLRAWDAPNGERAHVHSGEVGGTWRLRNRGPNTVAGVAFATEGFSKAQGFDRTPQSYDPGLAPFFIGISEDVIGDFGLILGGAAGDECDRFDLALGSPPQTIVLASATGFGPEYLVVNELIQIPMPDQNGVKRPDLVRADMVYVPVWGNGGVFSASSIAFAGAVAWNGFDNNAARLADNVLTIFVRADELPRLTTTAP